MSTTILNHPMIEHKLTIMRNKETGTKEFRQNLDEIGMLMAYEVGKNLPLRNIEIETPLTSMTGKTLMRHVVLVPILRAGLGLVDGFKTVIPTARVGHIGMARDEETLEPKEYYAKFPSTLEEADVFVLDPMLATGGTASAAITSIKNRGAKHIKFACVVAAPEGIQVLQTNHPDVDLYICAVDESLNEHGYIVPGLGDAGDRLFGTNS
ncbi:MAG: uracil phosphoribosyltransferase [Erysipelotrichaceae bacterium]|nr:uracil phosphoribosyltransferase [Erysipelotrichaceae bacterium]